MKRYIEFNLLAELRDHLRSGKLGHRVFDFTTYNKNVSAGTYNEPGPTCGTHGCAAGETPVLWPLAWRFNDKGLPVLIDNQLIKSASDEYLDTKGRDGFAMMPTHYSLIAFFGTTYDETVHLFYPRHQEPEKYGGVKLPDKATRFQVADNIDAFISFMQNKSINL